MPSSIGHALAGYAVARLFGGRLREDWPHVLAATVPDLDIAWAALRRRPMDYGHRKSHSVGAALAAGLALGSLARLAGGRFLPNAAKGSAAYASHLALDYFGKEAESGLPLLWPFSDGRFASRRPVFRTIYSRRGHFVTGLLTSRNLRRIGREVAIISPAVVAAGLIGALIGR